MAVRRWPSDFAAAPYVNPDAPKGGRLVQGVLGTFDSLNPLIVKGLAVQGTRGYVIESLMARGYDEPFTLYGLLARTIETDDARSYVTFSLDPAAHFSDGAPVTAADVLFSWQLLRDHGRPNHRAYYSKVATAEALDARTVRFDLGGSNDRELPLILGLMPVLPKHATDVATFEDTTLAKPVGSGPYLVAEVDPGKSVTLKRDPNYWGRDLPINRGLWNFEELRFDYYRDANAYFEAFKTGLLRRAHRAGSEPLADRLRHSGRARRTHHQGRVHQRSAQARLEFRLQHAAARSSPTSACGRRSRCCSTPNGSTTTFSSTFIGAARASSTIPNCPPSGAPPTRRERALLAPFPDAVRADVLDGTWSPPTSDGSGRDRKSLREALALARRRRLTSSTARPCASAAAGRRSRSRSW